MRDGTRARSARPPRRVGVLGAGTMGGGIALAAARAGMAVALIDREAAIAEAAKARGAAGLTASAAGRIRPGADLALLADAELVIESVPEDRAVKAAVIAAAAAAAPAEAVFATNTSSLPIGSLARHHPDPARFLGLHFFAPAETTPLVEVVAGAATGEPALATALAFLAALGKTAIVVSDSRGFYTSRLIGIYIREGHLLLAEGVPAAAIEAAARAAGMALGPLALNDLVGLDVSWSIVETALAELGAAAVDPAETAVLEEMVLRQGRIGRKSRRGFYDYDDESGEGKLWPDLAALFPPKPATMEAEMVGQRLLAAPALAAARLFQQGIVAGVGDADIGSIHGVGFPPPGALSWIDGLGTAAFAALCRELTRRCGRRFKPNRQLVELAAAGQTYRGRFPEGARRAGRPG